jgi:membrane-bound lytic murein transglycosylase B
VDWNWVYVLAVVVLNNLCLYAWKPWAKRIRRRERKESCQKGRSRQDSGGSAQRNGSTEADRSADFRRNVAPAMGSHRAQKRLCFGDKAFRKYLQTLDDYVEKGVILADTLEIGRARLSEAADELSHAIAICELFGDPESCQEFAKK